MTPVVGNPIFQHMVDLLAADTTSFANGVNADLPGHVILIKEAFTPSPDIDPLALQAIEADFTGYTTGGISSSTGTQNTAMDPLTSDYLLQLKQPAGGFRWETTGTTNLPQTIYGYAVLDLDTPRCYWSALFDTPVVLTAQNQTVQVDQPQLAFSLAGVG